MNLEETPGLTGAEQAAVAAYEEAHSLHVADVMDAALDAGSSKLEKAERVGHAVVRIEEAYSRLSELAPSETPGREDGIGYGRLLSLLRQLGLGESCREAR
jgi:hypothetical protein